MRILSILALLALAGSARAEQFWCEYDASCGLFPEECGWTRTTHAGGAVRSLADGILTLDSTATPMIADYYKVNHVTTPGPGEMFVATWRVCVAQQSGDWEKLAYFHADDGDYLLLGYYFDRMLSYFEPGYVPFAPGIFHNYRIESTDMNSYSLFLDGSFACTGSFRAPGEPVPFAIFGDGTCGTGAGVSRTEWDYFAFGVVPEPAGLALAGAAVCALRRC